jgi:L-alanine-DL-glutamate epimerase-like enolase superfamily enzyme
MKIEVLCLRECRMCSKYPFQASLGTTLDPRALFVEVHSDGLVGRGEITSGMGPFHSPEMPDTAWHILCYSMVLLVPGTEIAAGEERTDHRWYWAWSNGRYSR